MGALRKEQLTPRGVRKGLRKSELHLEGICAQVGSDTRAMVRKLGEAKHGGVGRVSSGAGCGGGRLAR